jgi:hypothetical protein
MLVLTMIKISLEIPVVRATAGAFDLLLSQSFLLFLFNIPEYFQHSPKAVSIFFSSFAWNDVSIVTCITGLIYSLHIRRKTRPSYILYFSRKWVNGDLCRFMGLCRTKGDNLFLYLSR